MLVLIIHEAPPTHVHALRRLCLGNFSAERLSACCVRLLDTHTSKARSTSGSAYILRSHYALAACRGKICGTFDTAQRALRIAPPASWLEHDNCWLDSAVIAIRSTASHRHFATTDANIERR